MSTPVPIEITTGKINSKQGSGKTYFFHSPSTSSCRAGLKETFLATALKETPSLGERISMMKFSSVRGILDTIGGSYVTCNHLLREGEVFKIFAQANTGAGEATTWNARMKTACTFIVPRHDAALNRLHILVPEGVAGATSQEWCITGRFDILTLDKARLKGVNVLPSTEFHFSEVSRGHLFRLTELAPALRSATIEKVKDVGGKKVVRRTQRRLLDLD